MIGVRISCYLDTQRVSNASEKPHMGTIKHENPLQTTALTHGQTQRLNQPHTVHDRQYHKWILIVLLQLIHYCSILVAHEYRRVSIHDSSLH
jgi:hypothetical protein